MGAGVSGGECFVLCLCRLEKRLILKKDLIRLFEKFRINVNQLVTEGMQVHVRTADLYSHLVIFSTTISTVQW
jgi:hypothetical protein